MSLLEKWLRLDKKGIKKIRDIGRRDIIQHGDRKDEQERKESNTEIFSGQ